MRRTLSNPKVMDAAKLQAAERAAADTSRSLLQRARIRLRAPLWAAWALLASWRLSRWLARVWHYEISLPLPLPGGVILLDAPSADHPTRAPYGLRAGASAPPQGDATSSGSKSSLPLDPPGPDRDGGSMNLAELYGGGKWGAGDRQATGHPDHRAPSSPPPTSPADIDLARIVTGSRRGQALFWLGFVLMLLAAVIPWRDLAEVAMGRDCAASSATLRPGSAPGPAGLGGRAGPAKLQQFARIGCITDDELEKRAEQARTALNTVEDNLRQVEGTLHEREKEIIALQTSIVAKDALISTLRTQVSGASTALRPGGGLAGGFGARGPAQGAFPSGSLDGGAQEALLRSRAASSQGLAGAADTGAAGGAARKGALGGATPSRMGGVAGRVSGSGRDGGGGYVREGSGRDFGGSRGSNGGGGSSGRFSGGDGSMSRRVGGAAGSTRARGSSLESSSTRARGGVQGGGYRRDGYGSRNP
eukprot:jgi/Mesvir1/6063/Mv00794-RA.1